jgi:tetratricopeptide (TPR) repeat protein
MTTSPIRYEGALAAAQTVAATAEGDVAVHAHRLITIVIGGLGRKGELLAAAERLEILAPGTSAAFAAKAEGLLAAGRAAEARVIAEARLATKPDDPAALLVRATAAVASGDASASALLPKESAVVGGWHNNLAWAALARPELRDVAIGWGEQAIEASQRRDLASLHTLATLLVEAGRVDEAHALFREALALDGTPGPEWMYVHGALAEAVGLPEVARAAYVAVGAPAVGTDPLDIRVLAQGRLSRLPKR